MSISTPETPSSAKSVPDAEPLQADQMPVARTAFAEDGDAQRVALEIGLEDEDALLRAVGASLHMEVIELQGFDLQTDLLDDFPIRLIHRHRLFPLKRDAQQILVVLGDPFDMGAVDSLGAATGLTVRPVIARPAEVARIIRENLGVGAETVEGMLAQTDFEAWGDVELDESEAAEMAEEASVVRLVNEILSEAVEAGASDIHIEAQARHIQVRYRIDGVLVRQPVPPEINRFRAAIISRLKIMSKLNIAERRIPQDGRIKIRVSGREVDIRLSIIPMLHGEGVVMRVLDKESMNFSLQGVGMADDSYAHFNNLIKMPHGIILVTGPTGSGKTTTLYSALSEIKSDKIKIVTTEDPIEYQLEGINQIQVHSKVGLTFAASLRAILRHDPDVVLIGEIRDLETAENAIQASLTGHLVFSTLHTNDAAGAFMRLIDMGVEPFLVSSTVEGVLAQRLVRTLCKKCCVPTTPTEADLPPDFPIDLLSSDLPIYRAVGCRDCRDTGYSGRLGLFELLITDDEIRRLASERAPTPILTKAACNAGMRSLREDGWLRVVEGRTTVEEVVRVTRTN
jgi:general secretion pathway protein E